MNLKLFTERTGGRGRRAATVHQGHARGSRYAPRAVDQEAGAHLRYRGRFQLVKF